MTQSPALHCITTHCVIVNIAWWLKQRNATRKNTRIDLGSIWASWRADLTQHVAPTCRNASQRRALHILWTRLKSLRLFCNSFWGCCIEEFNVVICLCVSSFFLFFISFFLVHSVVFYIIIIVIIHYNIYSRSLLQDRTPLEPRKSDRSEMNCT